MRGFSCFPVASVPPDVGYVVSFLFGHGDNGLGCGLERGPGDAFGAFLVRVIGCPNSLPQRYRHHLPMGLVHEFVWLAWLSTADGVTDACHSPTLLRDAGQSDDMQTLSHLGRSQATQDTVMHGFRRYTVVHRGRLDSLAKVLPRLPLQQVIHAHVEPHGQAGEHGHGDPWELAVLDP